MILPKETIKIAFIGDLIIKYYSILRTLPTVNNIFIMDVYRIPNIKIMKIK